MDDQFFDLADRYGILVMAGWCCCDHWEKWKVLEIERARSCHSFFARPSAAPAEIIPAFWSGSMAAIIRRPRMSKMPISTCCKKSHWPKPVVSSASGSENERHWPLRRENDRSVRLRAAELLAPRHAARRRVRFQYGDERRRGHPAHRQPESHASRKSPLADQRSLGLSRRRRIRSAISSFTPTRSKSATARRKAWPISNGNRRLQTTRASAPCSRRSRAIAALPPASFNGCSTTRGLPSSGISMISIMRPAGGYFGTKKACEPMHVQYSYDDQLHRRSERHDAGRARSKVTAKIYDLDAKEKYSNDATIARSRTQLRARRLSFPRRLSRQPPIFFGSLCRITAAQSSARISTGFRRSPTRLAHGWPHLVLHAGKNLSPISAS